MTNDPLQPERCARFLAAMAAPERLKIVRFLAGGTHTVGEIAEMLGIPAVNVAHHLGVLKAAGLIRGSKRGRFVDYSLEPGVLEKTAGAGALDLGCCRIAFPITPKPGDRPA